jgi:hypothetical protein
MGWRGEVGGLEVGGVAVGLLCYFAGRIEPAREVFVLYILGRATEGSGVRPGQRGLGERRSPSTLFYYLAIAHEAAQSSGGTYVSPKNNLFSRRGGGGASESLPRRRRMRRLERVFSWDGAKRPGA